MVSWRWRSDSSVNALVFLFYWVGVSFKAVQMIISSEFTFLVHFGDYFEHVRWLRGWICWLCSIFVPHNMSTWVWGCCYISTSFLLNSDRRYCSPSNQYKLLNRVPFFCFDFGIFFPINSALKSAYAWLYSIVCCHSELVSIFWLKWVSLHVTKSVDGRNVTSIFFQSRWVITDYASGFPFRNKIVVWNYMRNENYPGLDGTFLLV